MKICGGSLNIFLDVSIVVCVVCIVFLDALSVHNLNIIRNRRVEK